jgi:hypothetical protein
LASELHIVTLLKYSKVHVLYPSICLLGSLQNRVRLATRGHGVRK